MLFSSCGGKKPEEGEDQKKKQDNKKAIGLLDELEAQNEMIIKALNGPAVTEEGDEQQGGGGEKKQGSEEGQGGGGEKKQGSGEEQSGGGEKKQGSGEEQGGGGGGEQKQDSGEEQGGGGEKKQGSEEEQGGGGEKKQGSEEEQGGQGQQGEEGQSGQDILKQGSTPSEKEWTQVNDSVIKLHTMLNEYLPMAMQQGASQDLSSSITDVLNRLTIEAESGKQLETMLQANNLSNALSELYALHQDKRAPIKKIRYHTRNIVLAGLVADWKTTEASVSELKGIWDMQKAAFMEKEKETVSRIDLAVRDLQDVIAQKNQNLVKIKGNLLLTNLSKLEKSAKEQ